MQILLLGIVVEYFERTIYLLQHPQHSPNVCNMYVWMKGCALLFLNLIICDAKLEQ